MLALDHGHHPLGMRRYIALAGFGFVKPGNPSGGEPYRRSSFDRFESGTPSEEQFNLIYDSSSRNVCLLILEFPLCLACR